MAIHDAVTRYHDYVTRFQDDWPRYRDEERSVLLTERQLSRSAIEALEAEVERQQWRDAGTLEKNTELARENAKMATSAEWLRERYLNAIGERDAALARIAELEAEPGQTTGQSGPIIDSLAERIYVAWQGNPHIDPMTGPICNAPYSCAHRAAVAVFAERAELRKALEGGGT